MYSLSRLGMLQALASLAPVFKQGCSEVQVSEDSTSNNPPRREDEGTADGGITA